MKALRRVVDYLASPPEGHPRPAGLWPLLWWRAVAGGPSMCAIYAEFCRSTSIMGRVPVAAVM